jgi:tetratricopeptide (TPR) repeat protein
MRPLPALLLDFNEEFANGRLKIRRGKVVKQFDLVNGNPMSAASTPRDETLGHFLVANGVITDAVHHDGVARAAASGGRLGETLVSMGALSLESLFEQLRRQARYKLISALRWPQGTWVFDANAGAVGGMALRMTEVVLLGLKETVNDDGIKLSRLDNMSYMLNDRGKRLRNDLRRSFGDPIVELLASSTPIDVLEASVGGRFVARGAIDALLLCDALEATPTPVALRPVPVASEGAVALISDEDEHVFTAPPRARVAVTIPPRAATVQGMPFSSARLPAPAPVPTRALTVPGKFQIPNIPAVVPPVIGRVATPLAIAPVAEESVIENLFDGMTQQTSEGAIPLAVSEHDESGVVAVDIVNQAQHLSTEAGDIRRTVAAEHVRVRGLDLYGVLMVARSSSSAQIAVAIADRQTEFSRDYVGRFGLGFDQHKITDLHLVYQRAHDVLLDDAKRRAYDEELSGGELPVAPTTFDADLKFRVAEQLMQELRWDEAVIALTQVTAKSGDEADYLAALGWALWHQQGKTGAAIDAGRSSLNSALAANPDHAAAHEYRGLLEAEAGVDPEAAVFHLERAVEIDATRRPAMEQLERMLTTRGELRRLERICKRAVFRVAGNQPAELDGWLRLARVFESLDETSSVLSALTKAAAIAPNDPGVLKASKDFEQRKHTPPATLDESGAISMPGSKHAGAASADARFIHASVAVAIEGYAYVDSQISARYDRYRCTTAVLPAAPLEAHHWAKLRHPHDAPELGALVALLVPVIEGLSPLSFADVGVETSMKLDGTLLPAVFSRVLHEGARLLDISAPAVFARADLGNQIHVVATAPPAVIAGDEALTATERPDLVFRLIRALWLSTPGSAIGGSRPGRVLRAVVLAALRNATATVTASEVEGVDQASELLDRLSSSVRSQIRSLALRFLARGQALNLSTWSKAQVRTADRLALLMCGDVPAAFAAVRELGELHQDLIDFAGSTSHLELRTELRLSVR